jgi:ribosomal protein S18 acetylase RimI-like enzyme
MSIDIFRAAIKLDAEVIANLVNMAYRPESAASGWTHEYDLVSGSRTNADQILEIISKPDSVILLGIKGSEIVACIHIEKDGSNGCIGMFAVNPAVQGAGIGKQMLAYAEGVATENFSSDKFIMVVVSSRSELISFYQRRGYHKTGSIMDYPLSAGAGIPKQSGLKIEILEKRSDITIKRDALDMRPINQESL